jgi:hypothetical protein
LTALIEDDEKMALMNLSKLRDQPELYMYVHIYKHIYIHLYICVFIDLCIYRHMYIDIDDKMTLINLYKLRYEPELYMNIKSMYVYMYGFVHI